MTQSEIQVPSEPIHLEFVFSKEEFLEGQRIGCSILGSRWMRLNHKAMIPLGVLLIVEAVVLFSLGVERPFQIFCAALGLYFLLNRLLLWPWRMAKEFKRYPEHDSLRTFDIDEHGFKAKTSHGSGELLWERFSKFTETEKSFFLLAPPRFVHTLPKRAVPPELLEPLRILLSRKITKIG